MEKNISISVIVPAHNVARYIGDALDSLLNQSEKFHEIIIVDDGSTDGTAEIVDRYRGAAGVKVLHTPNHGTSAARNIGLPLAGGDYVYFFDSDDLLDADFARSMRILLAPRPDVDIVYFSGKSFLEPGYRSEYMPSYDRKIDHEYASGVAATGALLRQAAYFSMPCLYLSKKSLWADNGLSFMDILHEDEEIIMRLSCSAGTSLCLAKSFYKRRIRPGSTMTTTKSELKALGYLSTLESIVSYCRTNREKIAPIRRDLASRFYFILRGYLSVCKESRTRPQYLKILALIARLGRLPTPGHLSEIYLSPAFLARLRRVKQKLDR